MYKIACNRGCYFLLLFFRKKLTAAVVVGFMVEYVLMGLFERAVSTCHYVTAEVRLHVAF